MTVKKQFDLISSVNIKELSPFESFDEEREPFSDQKFENSKEPERISTEDQKQRLSKHVQIDKHNAYLKDENGQIYDLKPGIIGKGDSSDIRIMTSNYISKKHAILSFFDGQIFLQDLCSRNGTYVNGLRIMGDGKIALKPGDHIKFGDKEFMLKVLEVKNHEI